MRQADHHVLVLHLGTGAIELGAEIENFATTLQYVVVYPRRHIEKIALQVDATSLLRPLVQRTQADQRNPRFLAVVGHIM